MGGDYNSPITANYIIFYRDIKEYNLENQLSEVLISLVEFAKESVCSKIVFIEAVFLGR